MPHLSPTTLTADEQRLILRSTTGNPRDHTIISLALGTGLRLAEIVGLDVGDVFTPDGTPRVRVRIRSAIEAILRELLCLGSAGRARVSIDIRRKREGQQRRASPLAYGRPHKVRAAEVESSQGVPDSIRPVLWLLEAGINSPHSKVVEGDPVTLNLLLETIGVDGRSVDRAIEVVYSVHPETGMANYCVLNTYGAEAYEAPITAAEFDTLWALTKQPIPVFGKAHHAQNTYSHQLTVSDIAASVTYRR